MISSRLLIRRSLQCNGPVQHNNIQLCYIDKWWHLSQSYVCRNLLPNYIITLTTTGALSIRVSISTQTCSFCSTRDMSKRRTHISTRPGGKYGTGIGTQNGGGLRAKIKINHNYKQSGKYL